MDGEKQPARIIGRYAIFDAIASGGMATVHIGRLLGPVGFSRTVAIKRLHPQYASDPEFVSMFLDEARLAARIRHPNVVPTLDVVATDGELFLVMDYVPGESLSRLLRAAKAEGERVPPKMAVAILSNVLQGLHAAHDAKNERGEPLGIVHRDVSPQNILVGADGQARVLDFGVAKAIGRVQTTREGQLKGKISYMSPEQLGAQPIDRRSDIYSASVVLWEILTGQRLFSADNEGAVIARVLEAKVEPPSVALKKAGIKPTQLAPRVLSRLDEITLKGCAFDANERFGTAREMALALEECIQPATSAQMSAWVEKAATTVLLQRAQRVAEIESSSSIDFVPQPRVVEGTSSPSASSSPFSEAPTVALPSSPSNPVPEPVSQLSSVSVVSAGAAASAGRSRKPLLVVAAAAVSLCVVLAAMLAASLRSRGGVPTPASVASERATLPPPTMSTTLASAAPSAAASAEPAASASEAPAPSASAPKKRRFVPPPPVVPKLQCNPPYSFDAEGRKHYKPECL